MATVRETRIPFASHDRTDKPTPTVVVSDRIIAFTERASKSTGGAPKVLVEMYKAHAHRHMKK